MLILDSKEMSAADSAAVDGTSITSRLLMESAGREVVNVIVGLYAEQAEKGVVILAGKGNNAGDGYVVARLLKGLGYPVDIISLCSPTELKGDAKENFDAWVNIDEDVYEFTATDDEELEITLRTAGILVDAIYGTGLTGAPRDDAAALISLTNTIADEEGQIVVAVDIPSGVCASTGQIAGESILANATVTFQALKVGQVLFPGALRCGDVYVADISIPLDIPELSEVRRTLITADFVSDILFDVIGDPQTHKGTRGHVLVVGGSAGHVGAAKLSALAAATSGSGLATMMLPASIAQQSQNFLSELMCLAAPESSAGHFAAAGSAFVDTALDKKKCIVVGPGLGTDDGAAKLLEEILVSIKSKSSALVLDADGLNLLAKNPALRSYVTPYTVLTPHPGEMARLLNVSVQEVEADRLKAVCEAAEIFNCCVVLKGARSIVACPDGEIWINPTACSALATAGSGDVLSGIVGAFLARGLSPEAAACCAVFVHGIAGEKCMEEIGVVGTLAGDILSAVPLVITELLEEEESDDIPYPGNPIFALSV